VCRGLQFPDAPVGGRRAHLETVGWTSSIRRTCGPGPPESTSYMFIHSQVAGQGWLVWVLREVCWVRVYEYSSGPKVLGTGHLGGGQESKEK
jgi:hypothetical protein